MQITRSSLDTARGPADWFTGDVYIDTLAAPAGSSTFAAALVHFTPGRARPGTHILAARPSSSPRASACVSARGETPR